MSVAVYQLTLTNKKQQLRDLIVIRENPSARDFYDFIQESKKEFDEDYTLPSVVISSSCTVFEGEKA